MVSPSTTTFVEGLGSRNMWSGLQQRLLPADKWFGLVETPHLARRKEENGVGVVTGSIHGQAGVAKANEQALPSEPASDRAVP